MDRASNICSLVSDWIMNSATTVYEICFHTHKSGIVCFVVLYVASGLLMRNSDLPLMPVRTGSWLRARRTMESPPWSSKGTGLPVMIVTGLLTYAENIISYTNQKHCGRNSITVALLISVLFERAYCVLHCIMIFIDHLLWSMSWNI